MRIVFVDNSTALETVTDLERRARGGMVTSLFKITDYLSKRHDVTVLSDIKSTGVTRSGTKWLHEHFGSYDVLVTNRGTGYGFADIDAKHRVLWTHDLPHSGFIPEPKIAKAFSRVVFMSRYAERVWRSFYRTIGKSTYIPNGVDKKIFYPRMKDFKYLIYASAPSRGLRRLPLIFDAVNSRVGGVRMSAYSNHSVLHPNEKVLPENVRDEGADGFSLSYKELEESGVDLKDPVPQKALAKELGKAAMLIMPTDYPEICSNVVLQSLASATPVITTGRLGSACEWVKHKKNGMLTEWHPVDYMVYQMEMVRNIVHAITDPYLLRRMMYNAHKTKIYTWDQIGAQWERMLLRLS